MCEVAGAPSEIPVATMDMHADPSLSSYTEEAAWRDQLTPPDPPEHCLIVKKRGNNKSQISDDEARKMPNAAYSKLCMYDCSLSLPLPHRSVAITRHRERLGRGIPKAGLSVHGGREL